MQARQDSTATDGSPTVLVVSPKGRLHEALTHVRAEYDDLSLRVVETVETAFERLDGELDADILVSELALCDQSGIELVTDVSERYPDVPVLLAGPELTLADERAAMSAGAADAVRLSDDPDSKAILGERMKRVLRRSTQAPDPERLQTSDSPRRALLDAIISIYRETMAADDRETLAEDVCHELVAVDGIEFAWFGMVDTHRNRIEPAVTAGTAAGGLDDIGETIPLSSDLPAVEAVQTRDVAVVNDVPSASGHWADFTAQQGYESILSLPLIQNDYPTAVITVVVSDASIVTERDRELLTDIADVVSYGMTVLTWKQALVAETVTDLEVTLTSGQDLFSRVARKTGATLEVTELVSGPPTNRLFLTASDADSAVKSALEQETPVESITSLPHEDGQLFQLELDRPGLVEDIISEGGTLQELQADGKMTRIAVTLPVEAAVGRVMGLFERNATSVQLRSRTRRTQSFRTDPGFRVAFEQDVTDRQFEVLRAAYLSGYFAWPREHTGEEVATLLDISQPTFSRHLRRAQENLVGLLFAVDRD